MVSIQYLLLNSPYMISFHMVKIECDWFLETRVIRNKIVIEKSRARNCVLRIDLNLCRNVRTFISTEPSFLFL